MLFLKMKFKISMRTRIGIFLLLNLIGFPLCNADDGQMWEISDKVNISDLCAIKLMKKNCFIENTLKFTCFCTKNLKY